MADAAYDGIFGGGFSFTFTPTTGTPFGSSQAQIDEATPPKPTIETAKFNPISGSNSGVEQFVLGRYPVAEYGMKWTYGAAAYAAALACQSAKIKGTLVCTYGDGSTDTYVGAALTMLDAGQNSATNLRDGNLNFTCPVGPSAYTFSAGTAITVVQTTATLSGGSLTLDLTASPYSGGVKVPIRAFFLNPASNANNITIAKGATNGYTGFGSTFAITLAPGESCQLNALTALSGSVKTLDLTGTGSQVLVVQVQFQ
jgi:hypothetical protein